jgi:hypothetical protein
VALLAAAVLAVALVAGAVVLGRDDGSQPVDVVTRPETTAPAEVEPRLPAFGWLPAWFDGSFYATEEADGTPPGGVGRTVLAREAGDGTLDLFAIDLSDEPTFDGELDPATVLGRPAEVLQEDTPHGPWGVLVVPGEVEVMLSGPGDIRAVAEELGWGVLAPVVDGGVARPALGPLPEGWEVVDGPALLAPPIDAEIGVSGDGDASIGIWTGDWLATGALGAAPAVRPVVVDDHSGLLASGADAGPAAATTLFWDEEGIGMVLITTGLTDEEALAVAEGVELLDVDTWRARVHPDSEVTAFSVVGGELVPFEDPRPR